MKKLVNTILKKEKFSSPPIWIMRQAGRYLPEYLEVRSKVSSFLDLCYNPKLASEVTLQPINRFNLDGAIIFSDILVIPDALGLEVKFLTNEGPKLEKVNKETDLKNLKIQNVVNHLSPVFETISLTKSKLPKDVALIGFSGSPWTIASYMVEGGGSKNYNQVRSIALENSEFFQNLIDILVEAITIYLANQVRAGAEVIKLFDSFAGILPYSEYKKWVIEPNKKIILELKKQFPQLPIIAFPRGSGVLYREFAVETKVDCLAIDQNLPPKWVKDNLQDQLDLVIQGNLDNYTLAFGGQLIEEEVSKIMDSFNHKNFVFNLGHGILPQTPIKNVEKMLKLIRG